MFWQKMNKITYISTFIQVVLVFIFLYTYYLMQTAISPSGTIDVSRLYENEISAKLTSILATILWFITAIIVTNKGNVNSTALKFSLYIPPLFGIIGFTFVWLIKQT